MDVSVEAIVAIVGVVVALPPAALVVWKLLCRWRRSKRDAIREYSTKPNDGIHTKACRPEAISIFELPQFRSLDPTPSTTLVARQADYLGSSSFVADTAAGIDHSAGSRVVLSLQVRMDSDSWQFKRS